MGLRFAAPKIMEAFEEWVVEFEKEYENLQEKSKRMFIWFENHGVFCVVLLSLFVAIVGVIFSLSAASLFLIPPVSTSFINFDFN